MDLNYKKKIEHPTSLQLSISLIPAGILIVYVFVSHSFPMWVLIGMIASAILYMGLITYFCIKQKCYWQMIWTFIQMLPVMALLLGMYHYTDEIAKAAQ